MITYDLVYEVSSIASILNMITDFQWFRKAYNPKYRYLMEGVPKTNIKISESDIYVHLC